MRFKDKVVLVTGAVRNTGLAIAEAFAAEGAIIALNGRKAEDVAREAERLRAEYQITVVEVPADISRREQVLDIFNRIDAECGHIDVLISNAVIQGVGYSLIDTPQEVLEDVLRVNLHGAYFCAQEAARRMIRQGNGTIVTIGSNTAKQAIRNRTAYIASKGAVDSLTRAMAVELAPHGIRVNSVVPGYINTDRWDTLTTVADRRRRNIPCGKEATGVDVAESVLFMASEEAGNIHGVSLLVDGGVCAQILPADCDG